MKTAMTFTRQRTFTRHKDAYLLAAAIACVIWLCCPRQAAAQQWTSDGSGNITNSNTGNVGVGPGASSPPFQLTVARPSTDTDPSAWGGNPPTLFLRNTSATANNYSGIVFGNSASSTYFTSAIAGVNEDHTTTPSGHLSFFTKNAGAWAERLRISASGNVGIGTASPSVTLHVAAASADATTRVAQFYQPGLSTTNNYGFISVGKANAADQAAAFGFLMNTAGTDSAFVTVAGDDPTAGTGLFVRKGGNVGVGTAIPSVSFDVVGNATGAGASGVAQRIRNNGAGDATLFFVNPNTANAVWSVGLDGSDGGKFKIGNDSNTADVGVSTRLTIDASGNVGIGNSNPAHTLEVNGTINASGAITGSTINATYQDVAEWVPSTQKLQAGTVVVLDKSQTNHVLASSKAYDTGVAGVVSDSPGVILGQGGGDKLKVATTGRVRVKVDATRAPIQVGDLLVTGDEEGVAMKSIPVDLGGTQIHRPGTIIGKALEPLDKGTGEILVLLSLQ
jgi:hypothetical protein